MLSKIIRLIMTLIGILFGVGISVLIDSFGLLDFISVDHVYIYIIFGIIFGILLFILTPNLKKLGEKISDNFETELLKFQTNDIILGAVGLIIGLIIAFLISQPLYNLDIKFLGTAASVLVYLFFGYLGINIATRKKDEISLTVGSKFSIGSSSKSKKSTNKATPKILDTSVIIDGRIADICRTGFIEGTLIIPEFVLKELRHIADSADGLKRNRGRRGLDILNKLQNEEIINVKIDSSDFPEVSEVDIKLLKLAEMVKGKVLTNDFNLNKVAEFQGVEVLNINELANAVKPVVLPGEVMTLQLIREGKESGQGLAYLDDGTMIVVEGGKKYIGETIQVVVTSVLQTAAGRMIFAKKK
ncbi:MAG: PIN/TRAM domain-containing protein [Eubacteriales bacterium]